MDAHAKKQIVWKCIVSAMLKERDALRIVFALDVKIKIIWITKIVALSHIRPLKLLFKWSVIVGNPYVKKNIVNALVLEFHAISSAGALDVVMTRKQRSQFKDNPDHFF